MRTAKQLANLKPFKNGEYNDIQRKGTEKTKENAKNLKIIREWAQNNLFKEVGNNKTPLFEMIFKKLEQMSSQGNLKAIEMLLNYSGLKPIDKVETTESVKKIFITKTDEKEANDKIDEFIKNLDV